MSRQHSKLATPPPGRAKNPLPSHANAVRNAKAVAALKTDLYALAIFPRLKLEGCYELLTWTTRAKTGARAHANPQNSSYKKLGYGGISTARVLQAAITSI
ncbi:hypothetical protein VTO42DRAFT_6597 [Malbranchea cinnamomea]